MFHSHALIYLAIWIVPEFCSLQQPVKRSIVWSFSAIVSNGGQGYHSSMAINVGLSVVVDFGKKTRPRELVRQAVTQEVQR